MDPVSAARAARERLARGLASLQEPNVPPNLMRVAEPVAQAMSALYRIETNGPSAQAEAAPQALDSVRRALALLQTEPNRHPAVEQSIEAIAGSLGIVHELSGAPTARSAQQRRITAPSQPPAPAIARPEPHMGGYAPAPAPAPAFSAPAQAGSLPATQPSAQLPYANRPEPQPRVALVNPPAGSAQATAGPLYVEAELGAHSPTNFYKGLSGNDVVDAGGIFVATYKIPALGTRLMIRVSLPGGYEFEAMGLVRWTRETAEAGADAPPGFGAQFTQISQEGRQLVYRYARNREPLFHDDL